MEEQQSYQLDPDLAFRLLTSALDESAGLLKLYFTLSTGAVVLFINLLVQSHTSKFVAAPLALSIVAFGAEATVCLRFLLVLLNYRVILADAITTGASTETVKQKLDAWGKQAKKQGKRLERLFWIGIAFAVLFVAAIVFGR